MKKQFLIFATAITTVAFISCSKEKIETQQPRNFEEIATAKKPGGGNSFTPVSNKGLLGRFEFNNNLKDATGQLADGVSTVNRVLYTTDRKGQPDKAIRFNEAYGVNILDVPLDEEMTLSVWVKNDFFPTIWRVPFAEGSHSFNLSQLENLYQVAYWTGISGPHQSYETGPIDHEWHHVAATRDLTSLKVYIDGNLVASVPTPPGTILGNTESDYVIGYGWNADWRYWKGSMDDLRFYARVLSAAEINTLANL